MALIQIPATAAEPLRVSKPIQATKEDLDPQRTWAAPDILVHPDDPLIMVAGMHEFRTKECSLMRSVDGGVSWKLLDAKPALKSYPYCVANNSNVFQANLAWGRDNRLYMAMGGWDLQDTRSRSSILVARSDDLGDTWTTVVAHDARPTDDPKRISYRPVNNIVVDKTSASDDIVYVSYRGQYQNQPAGSAPPVEPTVSVSRDGAKTFAPVNVMGQFWEAADVRQKQLSAGTTVPNQTVATVAANTFGSTPDKLENFGASTNGQGLTLDGKGNLYYVWLSQTNNNVTDGQPRGMLLSKSTDQGKTWTTTQLRPFSYENRQNTRIAWSPDGGSNGSLHIVWEASRDNPALLAYADVVHIRSTDGGATWSEPKRLADDDPKNLSGKYIPNIKVAPNGRIDVAFWDTRDDPGIRANDVYYTYSNDGGVTWAKNVRMTDQTIDRRFGVWGINYDQNSPPSLASTNKFAVIGWDDTRFSRGIDGPVLPQNPQNESGIGSGVQDFFVATAQFEAIGGGTSNVAKFVLAGVIGLMSVGLMLTLLTFSRGRSADKGSAGSVASDGKKTATV